MNLRKLRLLALAMTLSFASAAAAQYRIGYVDTATVLEEDRAYPDMTWYWPSLWVDDGTLHLLAHGGDTFAGDCVKDAEGRLLYCPENYRCGMVSPGIDSFYGASLVGGQWQTPPDRSCPAFSGEYERCGYTPARTQMLPGLHGDHAVPNCPDGAGALCDQLYAPTGPVGSPSVLRIDHNNKTRYFMAYSGGNGDYIPGGIYWAVKENGNWQKYPPDGNGPIIYSKYWDCVDGCASRRVPNTSHGLTTVDIVYDENDHTDGSNVDGTIYFFMGYIHRYRRLLHSTDDPRACPPECETDCQNVQTNDMLVYRINYDPSSPTGLGSNREIFAADSNSHKKWMHHSGALVWDYDLSEFGEAATADPILKPQSSTNLFPGITDVKWNPDTSRWLAIGYFGTAPLGSLSRHKTQENASLAAADQWTGGPSSWNPQYEVVEISELEKAFPSRYLLDGHYVYVQYGGGLWYGTLGDKRGMWYFVPVRKRQFDDTKSPFAGLGIVPTLLEQCAYSTPPYHREQDPVIVPAGGQTVTIALTTRPECAWTVESSPGIDKNVSSGSGNRDITLTIQPNPSAARELIASVAGREIVFRQDGCAPPLVCACNLRHHAVNPPPPPPAPQPVSVPSSSGFDISVTLDPGEAGVSAAWFAQDSQQPQPQQIGTGLQIHVTPQRATRYWAVLTQACNPPRTDATEPITLSPAGVVPEVDLNRVISVGGTPKTYAMISSPDAPSDLSIPADLSNSSTYEWRNGDKYDVTNQYQVLGTRNVLRAPGTGTFWVRTTDAAGKMTDSAVTHIVYQPPSSYQPSPEVPASVGVDVFPGPGTVIGTQAELALIALPYPPPPVGTAYQYQWRQAKEDHIAHTFSEDEGAPVLNSDPANWVLRETGIAAPAAYWVRVVTPGGNIDSAPVLIVVGCDRAPYLTVLPSPSDPHVPSGKPIMLYAVGSARNAIYQWYSGPLGDAPHSTPVGSGGGVLTVTSPDGPYWVHATDDCGRSVDAGTILYNCKPTIPEDGNPQDVYIPAGDTAHLSVAATPARPGGALSYQWYAGNIAFPVNNPSSTSPTLNIAEAGVYFAIVSSACKDGALSGVQSSSAVVRTCTPPTLGVTSSHDVRIGVPQTLAVSATGEALTYQWYAGANASTSTPIPDATSQTLNVQPNVDSDYWVRVTDHGVCVSDSAVVHLTVCYPPSIVTQPAGSSVFSGSSATLTVASTAGTPAPIHYAWFEIGTDGSFSQVTGNDSPSFTTPALTTSRTWFVRVFSGNQMTVYTDSQPATVHVCDLPEVHWAVSPRPLRAGEPFTLQIMAPPAESQLYWYRGSSGDVAHSTLLAGPVDTSLYYQVVPDGPTSTYWVRVKKDSCYADSSTFTLTVCVPQITQQPAGAGINSGGSVVLSVAATTGPLTFQWYLGQSGDVSQAIAGATGASYSASPAADTRYWVRVTGSCNATADSDSVLVTVCFPPAIVSTAPTTQWAVLGSGSTTTVWVSATGNDLTYQWYVGNSGNTSTAIAGATASALNATPQNTTSYWARVSGSCGASKDSVSMLVNVCGSPAITAQPQGGIIFSGGTATMSVTATESTSTPMTYQWYRGPSGDVSAPVGTSSTTFTTPALTAQTSYWVRVSCGVCNPTDSQAATISICNYPQVLGAPADQFIAIGQTATLTTAGGSGNTWQWYVGASGVTSQPAPGQSNLASYTAAPTVTTQYWAQVQNGGCISRTPSATVNVCVPTITQQPASVMINSGASTTLSVAANTPGLTWQWYVGNSGTVTSPISGATGSSVSVSPAVTTNYWVRVTGSCSRTADSAAATVTICAPPAIIGASPTQSIVRGSNAYCFVNATGNNLTYQWYVGASGTTSTPISGATLSSLTIAPQNTTSYWVRVTGSCGTANSVTMLVNVCATPSITAQPQGSTIFSGSTATLSVTATEGTTTPMSYQWYRGASGDVSSPVGANATSFTTPALTAQTSYWVRVSCGVCNPADSQAAIISICNYPQVLSSPGDFYNTVGQSVRLFTSGGAGNAYQWYSGASGDTSHPYSSPNYYYVDVAPTVTTQYWAQVQSGGCISRTAAANVYVCVPTFTQQPGGATIAAGSSTTLTAAADTAGVTYQWYAGASGNTGAPIGGASGPSVTVTPASNSSYWVRAIGTCGRTVDSATATVTLCSPPVITGPPSGSTLWGAGTASVSVYATGSNLTYQWYYGESGDTTYPISGATSSTSSFWISATQKVWVRVTGQCGAVNSSATYASIVPYVQQQPPGSLPVGYDATATISFYVTGNYMRYLWKNAANGALIATTTTPTLITPAMTADMSIYCEVWSGNAVTGTSPTSLSVCYGPNATITKAPNGACSIAYATTNGADSYEWYQGARGDTSHPVSGSGSALYVCPTVATQYWMRAVVWSSYQVVSCYSDSNAVTLP